MNLKKMMKYFTVCLIGCFMLLTVNGASVKPGSNFSAVLRCGNNEGTVRVTASNASIVSGQANWCDRGKQINITAKANKEGTARVSLVAIDATNVETMKDVSGQTLDSKSVSVVSSSSSNNVTPTPSPKPQQPKPQTPQKPEDKKSSDATLSSLSVDQGSLSPEFSSSNYEYQVELNDDVTEITFSATANDSNATVENATTHPLKVGANSFSIDVTAQDGTKISYIVNINVNEVPKVFVDSENKMGILNNLEGVNIPKGFTETKITINDQEVTALVNEDASTTLLYIKNEEGVKNFYIYDVNAKTYSLMEPIQLCGLDLAAVEIPTSIQNKEGMTFTEITIDEKTYNGWKFNDENMHDYSLLYLMDASGNVHYYMHYLPTNSLQVYDLLAPLTLHHLDTLTNQLALYKNLSMGLGAVAGLLGIALVIIVVKNKKKKNDNPKQEEVIIDQQPQVDVEEVKEEFLSGLPEGSTVIIQDEEDDFLNDVTKNMTEILKNSNEDNV